jgi:putative flippase GtrA
MSPDGDATRRAHSRLPGPLERLSAPVLVQFVKFGVVGAVNGFLLNRRWTFAGHVGDSLTPVRWGIVQGCGLALNEALLYLFVHGAGVEKLLGQAFATAIVTVVTFFVNRAWTFRMHPPVAAVDADG